MRMLPGVVHFRVSFAFLLALLALLFLVHDETEAGAVINGKLVFVHSSGDLEIVVINTDGSGRRELTDNDVPDDTPAWSPDGRRIAFSRQVNGIYSIMVMNADGTDQHMISNGGDDSPSWSPDGTRIAFDTYRDGDPEVYVMGADGSNPHNISNAANWDYGPAWSPDGTKIAFIAARDGNAEIYVMDANGDNQTRLTTNDTFDARPQWSPDGSRIVFWRNAPNTDTFAIDADGGNEQQLTFNGTGGDAGYSPDGSLIAVEGAGALSLMGPDGSDITPIPNTLGQDAEPAWQPLTGPVGDGDCSGQVGPPDVLAALLASAGDLSRAGCLPLANVKCDDQLNPLDARFILAFLAEVPATLPPTCPAIGSSLADA